MTNRLYVRIKSDAKLVSLPVGGLLCIRSSPMFSDKIIALRQSKLKLVVLSYGAISDSLSYAVTECLHNLRLRHGYTQLHISTDACNISTSVLMDYTSYSHANWRYIRYKLGKAAVLPIVMHSDFFDRLVRNLHMFRVSCLKPTFVLLVQLCYSNISIFSLRSSMFTLLRCMMRSRTHHNTLSLSDSDLLTVVADAEFVEHFDGFDLDDDSEYKSSKIALDALYLELEQQLSVSGVLVQHNVCSVLYTCVLYDFSYLHFFIKFVRFCYMSAIFIIACIAYFIPYVRFEWYMYLFYWYRLSTYAFFNTPLLCYYYY